MEVTGNFQVDKISSSLKEYVNNYLPSLIDSGKIDFSDTFKNRFTLEANFKNTAPLFNFFLPGYQLGENTVVNASYEPEGNNLKLYLQSPFIEANASKWQALYLNMNSNDSIFSISSGSEKLIIGNRIELENFTINSETTHDTSSILLRWNNWDSSLYRGSIKALVNFEQDSLGKIITAINFQPTRIITYDSIWNIAKSGIKNKK
ncbi:MAG: hypothetical protein HC906_14435 [Bacteroidales bacterium]|nr:hypothetical protein [Bacteroidales bacterium]